MQGIRWAGGAVGFESHGLAIFNIADLRRFVKLFYDLGGKIKLAKKELKVIREASKEIAFGKITAQFSASQHYVVNIVLEKNIRF